MKKPLLRQGLLLLAASNLSIFPDVRRMKKVQVERSALRFSNTLYSNRE